MSAGAGPVEAPPAPRAPRRLSLGAIAGVSVLGSVAAKALAERLTEHDVWWHLRAGEIIARGRGLPAGDPFSFTRPGARWVVQQWGAETTLYGIESAWGLRGIIVWRALMLVAFYAVAARVIVREAGNTLSTWAIVALAAYAGAANWLERPILFSFLLFAVVLGLVRARSPRVWWCVPLAAVWANLHPLVIVGIGMLFLVALTEGWKVLAGRAGADEAWARRIERVAFASVAASLLNPYGPKLYTYSAGLIRTVSATAAEWASPNFHDPLYLPFLALAVLTIAALALSPERADPTDVVLAIAFLGLGLYAQRNLPISGVVLGLVSARYAPPAARAALRSPSAPPGTVHPLAGAATVAVVAAVLAALAAARFPPSGALAEVAGPELPVATVESLPGDGVRLFSDDRWAGLAIYARWPGLHVAFDGRGDFYGARDIERFQRIITGRPEWESLLAPLCPTHVLVEEGGGLAGVIAADPDWHLERSDPIAGGKRAQLFVPAAPLPGCGT